MNLSLLNIQYFVCWIILHMQCMDVDYLLLSTMIVTIRLRKQSIHRRLNYDCLSLFCILLSLYITFFIICYSFSFTLASISMNQFFFSRISFRIIKYYNSHWKEQKIEYVQNGIFCNFLDFRFLITAKSDKRVNELISKKKKKLNKLIEIGGGDKQIISF